MKNNIKNLTYTALLIAFAIIIPLFFTPLRIVIGPFSATLASHVPVFLAMFLGPTSAIMVGVGSTLGFLAAGTPIWIVARAFMHVFIGLMGAMMLKKGISFKKVAIITSPIHGILEGLAVLPFKNMFGFSTEFIMVTVLVGSILHHLADGFISNLLVQALTKSGRATFIKNVSAK
ncbi:ECF transporter S component [Clostridium aestuarii]|uniref:ECF transporter S component n=1 Tax=Clostridium aestuarii TaxID=338193 RepID=A0ABT4D399_9CLOT|nr:ECF transporter S component [Clostridium aestuarii]MCY6484675.1 ECF transporter S component [Clostridium aestuarii]